RTAYGRRMSQAAEERDAVERHFARSILALLAVTPEAPYGDGAPGRQPASTAAAGGHRAGQAEDAAGPPGADPAPAGRARSARTRARRPQRVDAPPAPPHLD